LLFTNQNKMEDTENFIEVFLEYQRMDKQNETLSDYDKGFYSAMKSYKHLILDNLTKNT